MWRVVGPPCTNSMVKSTYVLPARVLTSFTYPGSHGGVNMVQTRSLNRHSSKDEGSIARPKLLTARARGST